MNWNEVPTDDIVTAALLKLPPNPLVHPIGIGTLLRPSPLVNIIKDSISLDLEGSSYNRNAFIADRKIRIVDIEQLRRDRRQAQAKADKLAASRAAKVAAESREEMAA